MREDFSVFFRKTGNIQHTDIEHNVKSLRAFVLTPEMNHSVGTGGSELCTW